MQLIIIKGDITTIECDAIISSTNSELVLSHLLRIRVLRMEFNCLRSCPIG